MSKFGLWVDDIRQPPNNFYYKGEIVKWIHTFSVQMAKFILEAGEEKSLKYDLISIDHDAGDYAVYGGDYIELLNWLEETGRNYPIRIHSMNPVGVANMRAIIQRNGWREVR